MDRIVERIDTWLKNIGDRKTFSAEEIADMLLDLRLLAVEERVSA